MLPDTPPAFVSDADQGFAQAKQRLNGLLSQLAVDISQGDVAVSWASSVLLMLSVQATGRLPQHLIEVWQMALYRLAQQKPAPAGPDLSTLATRARYAATVVQELREADDEFKDAYYSMGHKGSGLCALLHDASDRLAR